MFRAFESGARARERIANLVSHGDREMPIWGDAFKNSRDGLGPESVKARIDAIVAYLAAIQERAAE